ncbi:5'/3'-nucleotidase SurE [bacterium 210820-DFI.6.37]|nr:5'/3'-nucleotidase SurE [bacterium 210820-DFI.6.37]
MNILVTNDDGINAAGIRSLVTALSSEGDIYVCAPHTQRSAAGHGITVGKPIEVEEVEYDRAAKAYSITGTPADCVKIGTKILLDQNIKIDMVFSGINLGGNLGTDTLYSGTVSAAIEGSLCGIPSVAVSVNSHHATHFELACELALGVCRNGFEKMDARTVLNINTPDLPKEEIKGVKYTRLGAREYKEWFRPNIGENGKTQYWYEGNPVVYEGLPDDIDVISMQDGYASITPLQYDMTNYDLIDEIQKWRLEG